LKERTFLAGDIQIDVYRSVGCSKKENVIASQCAHWRGNPFLLAKPEEFGDADRHGPTALAMTE
jgi:hypothetical protein